VDDLLYFIYEVEEWVGISPEKVYQVENLDSVVLEQLREDLEGKVDEEMGVIVAVLEAQAEVGCLRGRLQALNYSCPHNAHRAPVDLASP
jgi:hypothetical protein